MLTFQYLEKNDYQRNTIKIFIGIGLWKYLGKV